MQGAGCRVQGACDGHHQVPLSEYDATMYLSTAPMSGASLDARLNAMGHGTSRRLNAAAEGSATANVRRTLAASTERVTAAAATPASAATATEPLAVMVFIHGGYAIGGSARPVARHHGDGDRLNVAGADLLRMASTSVQSRAWSPAGRVRIACVERVKCGS